MRTSSPNVHGRKKLTNRPTISNTTQRNCLGMRPRPHNKIDQAYCEKLETSVLRRPEVRRDASKTSAYLRPGLVNCNLRFLVQLRTMLFNICQIVRHARRTLAARLEGTGVGARVVSPDGGIAGCALRNVPYLLASPDRPGTDGKPVEGIGSPTGRRKDEALGDTSWSSASIGVYTTRGNTREKKRGTNRRTRKAGKAK